MTYNLSQFFVARFTIQTILEILSRLEFEGARIKGDHGLLINSDQTLIKVITVADTGVVTNLHHYK